MKWRKKGFLVEVRDKFWWMKSHAMCPTPWDLGQGLIKLFFSGRDGYNRSQIGYVVIDLNSDGKILEFSSEPILTNGSLGTFDDNGVTPSCVLAITNMDIYLYYIGWNPGSTTRMNIFGGLAISNDGGKTFHRYSRAPIIERCRVNPYINTAPFAVKDDIGYKLFYVSGVEWVNRDLPRYNIQIATSIDALEWKREGQVAIDFEGYESALAKPFVLKERGVYKMWFASKGGDYRIKYAESVDGYKWSRRDDLVGIDVSIDQQAPDAQMMQYASVVTHNNKKYMFYNGNNYGEGGILWAEEEIL